MPIGEEHKARVTRVTSDLCNVGSDRRADACCAAAFLEHFLVVNPNLSKVPSWAHLDIAGPGFDTNGEGSATGFGTQSLLHHISRPTKT